MSPKEKAEYLTKIFGTSTTTDEWLAKKYAQLCVIEILKSYPSKPLLHKEGDNILTPDEYWNEVSKELNE